MNNECASASTPNNSWGFSYAHEQTSTIAKEAIAGEGRLKNPFLPFGSNFSACVVDSKLTSKGVKGKAFSVPFSNIKVSEVAKPTIYLGQRTEVEQEEAEEAYSKPIATLKSEQSSEESAKKTRETTEANERKNWENEEKAKKISNTKRKEYEAEQKTKREAKEKVEAENKTKREATIKEDETKLKAEEKLVEEENKSGVTVKAGETC
jgi:hypothetical protein